DRYRERIRPVPHAVPPELPMLHFHSTHRALGNRATIEASPSLRARRGPKRSWLGRRTYPPPRYRSRSPSHSRRLLPSRLFGFFGAGSISLPSAGESVESV